jgi:hypothetical protein
MSTGRLSSSLGETNVNFPFDNSALGSGRAFPAAHKICFQLSTVFTQLQPRRIFAIRRVQRQIPAAQVRLTDSAACAEIPASNFPARTCALAHANKIPSASMDTIL